MKWFLILWLSPLALFWGWYFLSLHDLNFGYVMLSRQVHDLLFELYGQALGIDPQLIPGMIAKALVLDTFLLGCILAFRRRKVIKAWWSVRQARCAEPQPEPTPMA